MKTPSTTASKRYKLTARTIAWATPVLLASVVLLTSCSYEPLRHEKAAQIGEAVIAQVEGSHAGLVMGTETNLDITLHVDISASMNGYAHSQDTAFCKLVQRLAQYYQMPIHALSTDLPVGKDSPPDYSYFQTQTNYTGTHDMANTVTTFTKMANRNHLLVTDSQPWDSGDKPAYDSVAAAINQFLSAGGTCSLGLFRSSYRGFYSSPLLAKTGSNQIFYNCTNRPFTVWIFAHRGSSASSILKQLSSGPPGLTPFFKYEFAQPSVQLVLTNQELKIHGHRKIGDLALNVAGTHAERVSDYRSIRLSRRAIDSQKCVNLQFDVFITNNVGLATVESMTNDLRVSLACWEVLKPQDIKSSRDRESLKTNPKVESNNFASTQPRYSPVKQVTNYISDYSLTLVTNTAASGQARLVIRIPRPPGKGPTYAWIVTLRRANINEDKLLPIGVSTDNDTSPDKSGSILNLSEVMGIVVRKTEKLGSLLFLTDYPR